MVKRQSDDSTLESSRHKLLIVWSESSMTLYDESSASRTRITDDLD